MTQPRSADQVVAEGAAHHHAGNLEAAEACYAQVIELAPQNSALNYAMGRVKWDRGDLDAAVRYLETAREMEPEVAELHEHIGMLYWERGELEHALAAFDASLARDPDRGSAWGYRGHVLQDLGRVDEAGASFRSGVRVAPEMGALWEHLAAHKTFTPDDPDVPVMREALDRLPPDDQNVMTMHFALAKARHDQGDVDRAFAHYTAANAVRDGMHSYDVAADEAYFARIRAAFPAERVNGLLGRGVSSAKPIFILGIPRSGSSLLEQILASHPSVQAGGERAEMVDCIVSAQLWGLEDMEFPDWVAHMKPQHLQALANAHLQSLPALNAGEHRFTDKMPANFRFVGLIRAMFPNAAIIHIHRTPADTCLSCFMQNFTVSIDYSFNLENLGRFYRAYSTLMEHWRSVLPDGAFLDVRYEDLLSDFEGEIARILEYCGLDWDDRCLAFHETERYIKTASFQQVRQPLYSTSAGRWRHYAPYLGPLFTALGDLAPTNAGG